jgi:hypothetical protein
MPVSVASRRKVFKVEINLEIEEDFVRRPNGLRRRSKRTTPATSSLFPVQPAYLPQPQLPSQPPAIQPLSLTSRVDAIKSRSTCKFITDIRK